MLTKEEVLVCDIPPNIREVSLELYKEFAEEYLLDKIFHYTFLDGTEVNIEFTEWGIYHMLGIQHINGKINSNNFFNRISMGLSFADFQKKRSMDNRFKKSKKRITAFACVYNCLKTGTVFYIPSGKVNGTVSVQMEYIVHRKINNISPTGFTQNGINIGIRKEKGIYTPLTILISKASDLEEYIKTEDLKIVKSLEIKNKSGAIIDSISHEFIMKLN